jgi:uncharacterized protein YegP (UPF0339 family)
MRLWKIQVVIGASGNHWLRIIAGNGETVLTSETYATRSGALQAADRLATAFGEAVTAAFAATIEMIDEKSTEGI